jgi:hypothetical protein
VASLTVTVRGAWPLAGLAVKAAVGAGGAVVVIDLVAVELPTAFEAVRVIVNVPTVV